MPEATKSDDHDPKTAREKRVAAAARAKAFREKAAEARRKSRVANKISGFMGFIREQGVIALAIGLAIGAQAGATVKAMVDGFITPIVSFIIGSQEGLQHAKWNVVGIDSSSINYWFTMGKRTLVISWGAILSSIITLVAVAAVIYFVVKGFKLDKLDKKKD